jgi:hypothetical protein
MARYKVQIDESFTHEMFIEAASAEDATEKAYDLLRDGIARDSKLQEEHDYDFEATEYIADYAEEWD